MILIFYQFFLTLCEHRALFNDDSLKKSILRDSQYEVAEHDHACVWFVSGRCAGLREGGVCGGTEKQACVESAATPARNLVHSTRTENKFVYMFITINHLW